MSTFALTSHGGVLRVACIRGAAHTHERITNCLNLVQSMLRGRDAQAGHMTRPACWGLDTSTSGLPSQEVVGSQRMKGGADLGLYVSLAERNMSLTLSTSESTVHATVPYDRS